jgi:NADPH2:quinone reductase
MGVRVVEVTRFGGPEVLVPGWAPDPVAGAGQVVVGVQAADVLFVDAVIRYGLGEGHFPVRPPYVPGNGVAGRVVSAGEGVDPGWVGRQVVVHTGGSGGSGGYAEQAVASAGDLVAVPEGVGPREAAALLHDGVTALGLMERVGVGPGEWVLVTGAGGGMGVLLVQLARAAGGRVVGAARGPRKLDVVRDVGAEAVVDYSEAGWAERVRELTGGRGPQVVFDGAGGRLGAAAFEVTVSGGRFSAHGMSDGGFAGIGPGEAVRRGVKVHGIEDVQFSPADARRLAGRALSEAAAGRLRPVIGQVFPLERAADAHAAMEDRTAVGKTLLVL